MNSLCSTIVRRCCAVLSIIWLLFSAAACSGLLGYGVLLWSIPEENLFAGDIVPVHIKSNISHVYVIGVPEANRKVEVPLWQIAVFSSKKDASSYAQKLQAYQHVYARVALDGLPVRYEPDNTARQMYRLRLGEIVKVLKKGAGSPVMAGSSPIEGDWLYVLTGDGTAGWCFSYNLRLFDERRSGEGEMPAETAADPVLDALLARTWYPENYKTMIDRKQVDPEAIDPSWGFDPGRETGIVRISARDVSYSSPYTGITKADAKTWRFDGSSVVMQMLRDDYISVQYTDAKGMPKMINFASLDILPQDIINDEMDRRAIEYAAICAPGPVFASSSYGVLQFLENNRFLWSGYTLLSPDVIPSSAGNKGSAEIRVFLDRGLTSLYDGVISFKFDNTSKYINFLYKIDEKGLRLENVSDANIRGSIVTGRNSNPLILFFASAGASGFGVL